jgi:hypothetical protein
MTKGELESARERANWTRYRPGQRRGHYESFFQRANHPRRPLAFWIRYTLFSARNRPEEALGELWAVFFDGETGRHVAVKKEVPFERCTFDGSGFLVKVEDALLEPGRLKGSISSPEGSISSPEGSIAGGGHAVAWDLAFRGEEKPLFLLPLKFYGTRLPSAKSLVGLPLAVYRGSLIVNGRTVEVDDWIGSQNHNWGRKHTDHYAWGQVAGFDTHPESFLELATARLKLGPFWTPFMTLLVLRHGGEEIALNSPRQSIRAKARFRYFHWDFRSETRAIRLEGTVSAPRKAFVGLNYSNPPGGSKHCLNSKIASCELRLSRRESGPWSTPEVLRTEHRAAFEILTDDRNHGVAIRA